MASRSFGGALQGLGQGLVRRAEIEREDSLIAREEERQDRIRSEETSRDDRIRAEDIQRDEENRMRDEAVARAREIRESIMRREERREDRDATLSDRESDRRAELEDRENERRSRGEEVADTLIDEDRNVHVLTRDGKTRGLGVRVAPPQPRGTSGNSSVADERVWDRVVQQRQKPVLDEFDEPSGDTETDWEAVRADFLKMGRKDLADQVLASGGAGEGGGGGELPDGAKLVGHTKAGAEVYETPDGQRYVVE
jgi:hypothetical protein